MRRALAVFIVACLAAPCPAAAQIARGVSARTGSVLPGVLISPALSPPLLSLAQLPLTLVSIDALLPSAQSVAVKFIPAAPLASVAPALVARPRPALPVQAVPFDGAPALSALYDGFRPHPSAAPIAGDKFPVPSAPLGSGLRMAGAEHEGWLASAVGVLAGTRTGRRILRDIDRLAARQERPILLIVKTIGNNGEFRYDSGLLVMDTGHLKSDPRQSAPILAHELQHVLQLDMELPVDALELEVESYTVENRIWSELGVEPEAGTFARQARGRITKDGAAFVKWLSRQRQYKENIPVHGSAFDSYILRLENKFAAAKSAEAKTRRKRAAVERVLGSMRANGMSVDAIAAHRREDLEPLDRSLRDGAVNRGWIERDLRLLSEPAARARIRAYARGVIRRALALSRS